MANDDDELIPTKASLLGRLKDSKDQSSWQEFFDTYSKLIYGVARKAGLTEVDARNVLHATMEAVAQHMPKFRYDPRIGSFKAWLLNLTRLQIIAMICKPRSSSGSPQTPAMETDPSGQVLDRMWEKDWEANLLEAATANVKRRLEPGKYQIYDFCVNKKWSPEKVAAAFGLLLEQVLDARREITEMIHAEARRLEQQML
jgi:RNA polymerase sigma-70 factor (ECF subfamily)